MAKFMEVGCWFAGHRRSPQHIDYIWLNYSIYRERNFLARGRAQLETNSLLRHLSPYGTAFSLGSHVALFPARFVKANYTRFVLGTVSQATTIAISLPLCQSSKRQV